MALKVQLNLQEGAKLSIQMIDAIKTLDLQPTHQPAVQDPIIHLLLLGLQCNEKMEE